MTAPPAITLRFDAGDPPARRLRRGRQRGRHPPGCVWDPRVRRYRAPRLALPRAWSPPSPRLARAGGSLLRRGPRVQHLSVTHRAQRTPFEHQREAIAAWRAAGNRGVVVLPTGAGKSYVAEMAIALAQRSALVVAPTLDLMNQWYDVLVTAFGEKVGLLGGGYHEPGDLTVSTYDSAWMHMDRLGARWGLIIYDECHHLPGASFLGSAESAIAPFRLGLTATLERSDGREALLNDRVGAVVYSRGIKELAGDHLAEYSVETMMVDLTPEEAAAYNEHRETYRSFVSSEGIRMASPDGWARFLQASARSPEGPPGAALLPAASASRWPRRASWRCSKACSDSTPGTAR
ncbi:MAG: DEAD/DEAH box helicase [Deltaproteobacteria bacterium]|nr:DEAD/DEAH box helicase [Deltaproteobacteria bacterium]